MNSDIKELTSEIRDLAVQMKKVEADVAIVKNVNKKLLIINVNQLIETERQCWANSQYSRRECLEVVGIPTSIPKDSLEANISKAKVSDVINLECMPRRKTFRHVIV